MAKLVQPFNARNVDPTQGVGGLPIGKYPVVIVKSEVKPVKDKDAGYLQLDLQITQGEHAGTTGAYRLNLYHTDQQTVQIAHRQLSAICHVTGVLDLQDSAQLHNIPFMVEVTPQKDPKYTEVKRVYDINGNEPGQQGQGAAPQGQQQPNPGQGAAQGTQGGGWNQSGQQGNQQAGNAQQGGGWNQSGGQQQTPANNVANNVPMPDNNQQQQPNQQQANGGQSWGNQGANGGGQQGGWQQNGQQGNGGQPSWGQR